MGHVLVYAVALLIAYNAVNGNPFDKLQCKDENGMPVDWYVAAKLPKLPDHLNPQIKKGIAYLYMTDQTADQGWRLSNRGINANNSIVANTLAHLYNAKKDREIFWALYNDQPPGRKSTWPNRHAKGVLMLNKDQGFWLIHSVPKFPSVSRSNFSSFEYPRSGRQYGQSFLCVSFGSDQFYNVGKQLQHNEVATYAKNIPDVFTKYSYYPSLYNMTRNGRIYFAPFTREAVIKSLNSMEFISFAKASNWKNDLYDKFVAPRLQTDLIVQSWLNPANKTIPTICDDYRIYNVQKGTYHPAHAFYSSTSDHSKWAVAIHRHDHEISKTWVCIGDINRVTTQRKNGGGALCFKHPKVWDSYQKIIETRYECVDD